MGEAQIITSLLSIYVKFPHCDRENFEYDD